MVVSTATLRDEPYGALWTTTTVRVLWTVSGARTSSALTAAPSVRRGMSAYPHLHGSVDAGKRGLIDIPWRTSSEPGWAPGAQPSLRNQTVASGGTTMSAYAGCPWWSPSTAVIEPRLPTPEPW
jgi:hypothetical protein